VPDRSAEPLLVHVDVSDTLGSPWRAGIQRVVVQLVDHLRSADDRVRLVPVVWSAPLQAHRHLRPEELADLLGHGVRAAPPSPAPRPAALVAVGRPVARAVRLARRGVGATLRAVGLREPLRRAVRWASLRTVHRDHVELAVGELPPGSVLFDLDTVWNQTTVDRDELYRQLHDRGVHVAALVYDLLPVEHPEWFERSLVEVFDRALTAQARHAELVLAISGASADSFTRFARSRSVEPREPLVVGLGADALDASSRSPRAAASLPAAVPPRRYALVVGTVEPRKNHRVLLDAFEQLWSRGEDLHLVVVGRPGWENDEVVRRLGEHPRAGSTLHWFRDADDSLLWRLYEQALVVAVPSATEGFGLPVVEAFGHGVPVVASDRGALPEVGGDRAEYVAPDDVAGWAGALLRHLQDPIHHEARRVALVGYEPPTWRQSAATVAAHLADHFSAPHEV
jgi:glycosyltransferase involved in cell wall biosynthesis